MRSVSAWRNELGLLAVLLLLALLLPGRLTAAVLPGAVVAAAPLLLGTATTVLALLLGAGAAGCSSETAQPESPAQTEDTTSIEETAPDTSETDTAEPDAPDATAEDTADDTDTGTDETEATGSGSASGLTAPSGPLAVEGETVAGASIVDIEELMLEDVSYEWLCDDGGAEHWACYMTGLSPQDPATLVLEMESQGDLPPDQAMLAEEAVNVWWLFVLEDFPAVENISAVIDGEQVYELQRDDFTMDYFSVE